MLKEVITDTLVLGVGTAVAVSGVRGGEFFYGPLQGSVRGPRASAWLGRTAFILIGSILIAFDLAHIFFGFGSIPH